MKIQEDVTVFPTRKFYVDVDAKFTNFTPKCRVLPVVYYEDPTTHFELKAIHAPGEKRTFPNGGFEVYGPDGGVYNYDLDQVVVHPYHLKMMKYFTKTKNVVKEKVSTGVKGKRGRPSIDPSLRKTLTAYVPTGGSRGRKPMSPELKAIKDAEKAERTKNSNGKRGRPSKAKV
jgi:hypothetical protein